MEETELFEEILREFRGEIPENFEGEFPEELREVLLREQEEKFSHELKILSEKVKETKEQEEKLTALHRATPLFRTFRELEYEPQACKECEKFHLAKKEGVEAKLIGLRLESPVGLFVLEGCNFPIFCSHKKKTFVLKCMPLDIKDVEGVIIDLEEWLYGVHRVGEMSYFWEKFPDDEEGIRFAKEILKKLFLFGEEERAKKVLESYPFPAHFNAIFDAFIELCPHGILAYPYMTTLLCSLKSSMNSSQSLSGESEEKVIRSVEEFEEFFYSTFTRPYENLDTFYIELHGNKSYIGMCYCLTKRHHAFTFGSKVFEFLSITNKEWSGGPIQALYGLTRHSYIIALGDLLFALVNSGSSKEKIAGTLKTVLEKFL